MRTPHLLAAAVLVAFAFPAAAQLRNHSIAVETGLTAPLDGPGGEHAAFALAATTWLEGSAEVFARVAYGAAPQPEGRAPAGLVAGTAGIRVSLLPDPLRPQLGLELGWARWSGDGRTEDRLAFGASAGLEWFPARDLSVAARGALRGFGAGLSLELVLAAAAYF
jgi:hypothetical protein